MMSRDEIAVSGMIAAIGVGAVLFIFRMGNAFDETILPRSFVCLCLGIVIVAITAALVFVSEVEE